jgi:phosphotriesterase-related protein
MASIIRTATGDLEVVDPCLTLVHEHVYCDFAAATGDDDLNFTDSEAIALDLADARQQGVEILVEVSTYDMRSAPERIVALCGAARLSAVKSTGWFRSPWLDAMVANRDDAELAGRLVEDICGGFSGTEIRAGVIGEVGITGTTPTAAEARALDAAAEAAVSTGVGVIAHTDDWANACAVLEELVQRRVPPGRIMLGHARVDDPFAGQKELLEAGVTLAFDQLGHPARDAAAAVAQRIHELVCRDSRWGIALSADLGRRSRLRSAGGSGYVSGVRRVLDLLTGAGVDERTRASVAGGAATRFLSFEPVGQGR